MLFRGIIARGITIIWSKGRDILSIARMENFGGKLIRAEYLYHYNAYIAITGIAPSSFICTEFIDIYILITCGDGS